MIQVKRIFEKKSPHDGLRFLVDRLWPRNVSKVEAQLDAWQKDVGPSDHLRKWFSHDPAKWPEFQQKYFSELDQRQEAWKSIFEAAQQGTVTLLYSSRDTEHNNAVALKSYLERKLAHTGSEVHHQSSHKIH